MKTQNKTLRRKETELNGRTDADDAFNPSELWLQFDQDDFSDLGIFAGNSSPNPDPEPEPEDPLLCGADKTLISSIQGEGASSPLVNTVVEFEGVVTADFQADDQLKGFFCKFT